MLVAKPETTVSADQIVRIAASMLRRFIRSTAQPMGMPATA